VWFFYTSERQQQQRYDEKKTQETKIRTFIQIDSPLFCTKILNENCILYYNIKTYKHHFHIHNFDEWIATRLSEWLIPALQFHVSKHTHQRLCRLMLQSTHTPINYQHSPFDNSFNSNSQYLHQCCDWLKEKATVTYWVSDIFTLTLGSESKNSKSTMILLSLNVSTLELCSNILTMSIYNEGDSVSHCWSNINCTKYYTHPIQSYQPCSHHLIQNMHVLTHTILLVPKASTKIQITLKENIIV